MQASSRARRNEYIQRQNERIAEQERALQTMTTRLEERERMVNDLLELNEMNRLLITRYQEYEDREAEVDDEENSRSSRERRRYTDQIDRLKQQLEDRRLEYEGVSAELHRLRRDRDDYHHWTVDWDVATIIQALEELYPLQQEHRHLDRGSRWLQVVADSRSRVRIFYGSSPSGHDQ